MSFSSETKEELCNIAIKRKCCARAALGAMLHMSGSVKLQSNISLTLTAESFSTVRWCVAHVKKFYDVESQVRVLERKRLGKNRSFYIDFNGEGVKELLHDTNLLRKTEDGWKFGSGIDEELIARPCCKRSFMRGLFIAAGSISSPEKGYHLEFVFRSEDLAVSFCELLNTFDLHAKIVTRKSNAVVYLKESEKIAEFLTLINAGDAILKMENWRALRDFRNNVNRQVNCETANIQKTITAASRQVDNIRYLIENDGISALSIELQEAARARVDYPDVSLSELGSMLGIPIGKSGMNHRLRKLEELARAMRMKKGDI